MIATMRYPTTVAPVGNASSYGRGFVPSPSLAGWYQLIEAINRIPKRYSDVLAICQTIQIPINAPALSVGRGWLIVLKGGLRNDPNTQ